MNSDEDCPIYIINLKNKETELVRTLKEIRKLNFFKNIIIHEATGVEESKIEHQRYITKEAYENINNIKSENIIPTWGAVGCALSHRDCWKDISKRQYEYAIICEDDIKINDTELFKFNYYESKKLYELNKFRLNGLLITMNSKYMNDEINICGPFTGTSFYIIDRICAEKLLNIFPITNQIDIEIGLNKYNLNIEIYNKTNKNKNITYYPHVSSVQYYFITLNNLIKTLKPKLPNEIIERIYYFLNKRNEINNEFNFYGYNIVHD